MVPPCEAPTSTMRTRLGVLFLGGYRERGEFGVEGVDAYGGDGGPFVLSRNSVNALSKMGRFSGWEPRTLIPTANLRMMFDVRPITLIQSRPFIPFAQDKGL